MNAIFVICYQNSYRVGCLKYLLLELHLELIHRFGDVLGHIITEVLTWSGQVIQRVIHGGLKFFVNQWDDG